MKEKLMSRKLWLAILSSVISIIVVFTNIGGVVGTIAGIIGVILSSISYMISESNVDIARSKQFIESLVLILEELYKKGGNE